MTFVVFSTEFSRANIETFKQLFEENIGGFSVHDATTPTGNDDIIKISDDQEDEDSTRRRPGIE